MNSSYRLMERLAHITAFKDTRRLELSLLKTLHELFKPDTLSLVKLNTNNQPLVLMRYDPETNQMQDDDPALLGASTESLIINALNQKNLNTATPRQREKLSVFPVLDLFDLNLCLVLNSSTALSADDIRLIRSFLDVYRNFCLLIEDVQTDQLTGLLNRKTFEENFQRISEELPEEKQNPDPADRRAPAPAGLNGY